jgi:cytidylate kinase
MPVTEPRIIAIDGPAGSGKSTVARELARRLGLDYLDTGAMYRSVAFAALQHGIDPEDREQVARLARRITIEVGDAVLVDGYDATIEIRGPEVTRAVSAVAAIPEVRVELRDRQRAWAKAHPRAVVEGRDIGTVVFPDAELKVFLTASSDERARRRHQEVTALHYDPNSPGLAVETVEADLARRDRLDSSRAVSPLAVADDAIVIDTTGRTVDDIVEEVLSLLKPEDGPPDDAPPQDAPPQDAPPEAAPSNDAPPEAAPSNDAPSNDAPSNDAPSNDAPAGRPAHNVAMVQDSRGVWRPEERSPAGAAFDRAFYRLCRALVLVVARTYWRLSIDGRDRLPTAGPYIVAPVHRSNVDTPLVGCITTRRLRFMGKDSLWAHRASARFFSALGGFPVHRGTVDRDALRRCIEVIESGEPLVLFPEGTRQSGPLVQHLFEGAAYVAIRTGVPIVPVGVGGSARAMPKGAKGLHPARVAIVVGDPVLPPPAGRGSRRATRELTAELHKKLQEVFDLAQVRAGS